MERNNSEIRVYVACLAAYNNGVLHGKWIDANQDPYDIWGAVSEMLQASPIADAEEWAIHDYEGFEGARIAEYEGFDEVSQKAALIAEHGKLAAELIGYFGDIEDAKTALADRYAGEFESLSDFAREMAVDIVAAHPKSIAPYIDYDAMGRDLAISDVMVIQTHFNEVHVFWEG